MERVFKKSLETSNYRTIRPFEGAVEEEDTIAVVKIFPMSKH